MMIFRRIFRLLLPEERKTGVRVVLTVLCSAVLDLWNYQLFDFRIALRIDDADAARKLQET